MFFEASRLPLQCDIRHRYHLFWEPKSNSFSITSCVSRVTQLGKKVWVNTHTSSLEFLESLDKDEEIETLIHTHKSIQFKDRTF